MFDISRYGQRTQEQIIALDPETRGSTFPAPLPLPHGTGPLTRAIALAQSVREAEDRAATRYAAEARATRR